MFINLEDHENSRKVFNSSSMTWCFFGETWSHQAKPTVPPNFGNQCLTGRWWRSLDRVQRWTFLWCSQVDVLQPSWKQWSFGQKTVKQHMEIRVLFWSSFNKFPCWVICLFHKYPPSFLCWDHPLTEHPWSVDTLPLKVIFTIVFSFLSRGLVENADINLINFHSRSDLEALLLLNTEFSPNPHYMSLKRLAAFQKKKKKKWQHYLSSFPQTTQHIYCEQD